MQKQDVPAYPVPGIKIDLKTRPSMRNSDTIQQISIKTDGIKDRRHHNYDVGKYKNDFGDWT